VGNLQSDKDELLHGHKPEELNRETDKMAVEFHRAQVGEWRFDHRNKTIQ